MDSQACDSRWGTWGKIWALSTNLWKMSKVHVALQEYCHESKALKKDCAVLWQIIGTKILRQCVCIYIYLYILQQKMPFSIILSCDLDDRSELDLGVSCCSQVNMCLLRHGITLLRSIYFWIQNCEPLNSDSADLRDFLWDSGAEKSLSTAVSSRRSLMMSYMCRTQWLSLFYYLGEWADDWGSDLYWRHTSAHTVTPPAHY